MLAYRLLPTVLASSRLVRAFSSCGAPVVLTETLSSQLKDPLLLTDWVASTHGSSYFDVYDPASPDTVLAQVPSSSQIDATLQEMHDNLPSWRDGTTASFRGSVLTDWSNLVKENVDDLATIMSLESGKPMKESFGEVSYAASFLDFYASEAIRSSNSGGGFLLPTPFAQVDGSPKGQLMARHQAVGLTAMITPWNFPSAMITRKCAPALAAGCVALVKPSELTPLSAIALVTLAYRAGVPRDVLQVVTSSSADTPAVGASMCTNPLVRKISFTGSTAVGKRLMRDGSDTVKRFSLELGGNAPFVVFDDADIEQAVTAAMASKFRNAGQTCVCGDRFLVHSSIHDDFVERFVSKTKELVVGPGMDETTTMGPLISEAAVDSVAVKVEEALKGGAFCHFGGEKLPDVGSHFYSPTILSNVAVDSDLWKTETFGPVAAIRAFDSEEEALGVANDSTVGLASYFCTKDLSRAFRFSHGYVCVVGFAAILQDLYVFVLFLRTCIYASVVYMLLLNYFYLSDWIVGL